MLVLKTLARLGPMHGYGCHRSLEPADLGRKLPSPLCRERAIPCPPLVLGGTPLCGHPAIRRVLAPRSSFAFAGQENAVDASGCRAGLRRVTAGYFQTLGIPILNARTCRMDSDPKRAFEGW